MDKNYFELRSKNKSPKWKILFLKSFFDNFDCEGIVLAEEAYKDLELVSSTEGTLRIFFEK